MAKQLPVLTEQELEIMKVVWERDSVTVRDVYETLRAQRQIAYTTVMTMMRILERKGHLKVSRADRAYVYRPARGRQRVLGEMVHEFVDRFAEHPLAPTRSEEHTSELQSPCNLVCRLLLEKNKQ